MAEKTGVKRIAVSRRGLLTGGAVAGGLLVAWSLWPRRYAAPLTPGEGEAAFGGWLTLGRDGVVTVSIPQLEMGQGITTILAQIAAVELGADWRQIAVEPAPPAGLYANLPLAADWSRMWSSLPSFADEPGGWLVERFARSNAFTATAAGTSLAAYELPLREAAASARDMLTRAAAARFDIAPEECLVENGLVLHGGKALAFGVLVDEAAALEPPDPPPLRSTPAFEEPTFGEAEGPTAFPRLDLPAKIDGSFLFAGDIRLPGMVYASIRHGPWGTPELLRFDPDAAAGMRGLVRVIRSKRWLAAVATSWWIADQALSRMRAQFAGPGAVNGEWLDRLLERGIDEAETQAQRIETRRDPDDALAANAFTRRYTIAPALHAPLETASATARLEGGRLELWMAAQVPEAAREAAAKAVGVSTTDVVFYPMAAGGSFDARLEKQHAIEVAQIAANVGRPVQLTWSRPQDLQIVPPRPPIHAELQASRNRDGEPTALRTRLAMPSTMLEMGRRLFANATPEAAIDGSAGEADVLACEGAVPPYAIANVAVDHIPVRLPIPTMRMRGGSAAYTAFFTESFVDEMAAEAQRDPFLFRMAMLGEAPRLAECLRRATELAGWGGGRRGSGQGLAIVRMGRDPATAGHIACVAEVAPGAGGIAVTRLVAVCDIGRIVNLDIARQQIEGGLIFGMGLATGREVIYEDGRPQPGTLGNLSLPILASSPDITVDFIANEAAPFDPGELGVAAAPPAIGNALFSATGQRYRNLPLLRENA